ncbi:MAG: DR2241 family protein [Verrucomicrobiota bacterium]
MSTWSLAELLKHGARLGQVAVTSSNEKWRLTHRDDIDGKDLREYEPGEAATIARWDDTGRYRPLKTAPNLRHGWKIVAEQAEGVLGAIEAIYPGRMAVLEAFARNRLKTTPLRETLGRQTGMYRVAAGISEGQIDELIGTVCKSQGGCLRTILWRRDERGTTPSSLLSPQKFDPSWDQTGQNEIAAPLLCQEACNIVVAAARSVVKSKGDEGQEIGN